MHGTVRLHVKSRYLEQKLDLTETFTEQSLFLDENLCTDDITKWHKRLHKICISKLWW